jgi:hypothetical protein
MTESCSSGGSSRAVRQAATWYSILLVATTLGLLGFYLSRHEHAFHMTRVWSWIKALAKITLVPGV